MYIYIYISIYIYALLLFLCWQEDFYHWILCDLFIYKMAAGHEEFIQTSDKEEENINENEEVFGILSHLHTGYEYFIHQTQKTQILNINCLKW